jgi:hypothetical protein
MPTKTNRPARLYIDQFNNRFFARTRKDLSEQIPGKVSIMYIDKKNGTTVRIGYVIGQHWLECYVPFEQPA